MIGRILIAIGAMLLYDELKKIKGRAGSEKTSNDGADRAGGGDNIEQRRSDPGDNGNGGVEKNETETEIKKPKKEVKKNEVINKDESDLSGDGARDNRDSQQSAGTAPDSETELLTEPATDDITSGQEVELETENSGQEDPETENSEAENEL